MNKDLIELMTFAHWVTNFDYVTPNGRSGLMNMLDGSFIDFVPDGAISVTIGNVSESFKHLPEAAAWLWRNHSVDNQ